MTTATTWDKGAWTPRHRGHIYCSPACGGRCTREAFEISTQRAKALCRRMGSGWKPKVWENLGWHYKVVSPCNRMTICGIHYGAADECYYVTLGRPNETGIRWTENEPHNDPKALVKKIVAKVKQEIKDMQVMIEGL